MPAIAKSIPGYRFDRKSKTWLYPLSPHSAVQLIERCRRVENQKVEIGCFLRDYLERAQEYVHPMDDIPLTKQNPPPWPHQRKAFWFTVKRLGGLYPGAGGGVMLALDMGTGKSRVAIDLIANYGFKRTLVVCPSKVIAVWPYQIRIHAPKLFRVEALTCKRSTAARAEQLLQANELLADCMQLVVITNYEATRYHAMKNALKKVEWDCLILDEVHRIKDPRGTDSRFFHDLGRSTPFRLGLTGTPIPNTLVDIFAQARFLDASIYGSSFPLFRARYCIMGGFEGKQVVGFQNQQEVSERMARFAMQVSSDEVQNLPAAHHIDIPITLEKRSRDIYERMEEDFTAWVSKDKEVTASNTLVRLLKLQEITGGFLRDPDSKEVTRIGTEKEEALQELLQDLGQNEPVMIFYRFKPDLDAIRRACAAAYGDCSELSGQRNQLAEWQAGETLYLAAQISSGKEGIDATRARYAVYYSLGFQPGEFAQSQKRILRPGQKKTVHFYHLIGINTVDRRIYRALHNKSNAIESVLREVRDGRSCEEALAGSVG